MDTTLFTAVSLYRRREYDRCIDTCNGLLHRPSALLQGPAWELKMRAMTQRVYVEDVEADDGVTDADELDSSSMATAPRPGTSLRQAATTAATASITAGDEDFGRYTRTGAGGGGGGGIGAGAGASNTRPKTSAGRPITGMSRAGTSSQRAGTSAMSASRTAMRTGAGGSRTSSQNIRIGSASMFVLADPTGPLFQSSRLHPAQFARKSVAKALFQFLYYHEGDVRKALDLCEAVSTAATATVNRLTPHWWWSMQRGRCLIALGNPRGAEPYLRAALNQQSSLTVVHPVSVLLLARVYVKLDQPLAALEVCAAAADRLPGEMSIHTHQARIMELLGKLPASVRMYRQIVQQEPINAEALACIAVHYFYANQAETAAQYYRRILAMGAHSAEIYCNIGLCCLYGGGQLDLVLPCFQRALRLANTPELRADIWYNLSFVAITTGDFSLARRCLRLCISTDGSHGAAMNNLAILAARGGLHSKAKSYLSAAASVLPDCDEIRHNLKLVDKQFYFASAFSSPASASAASAAGAAGAAASTSATTASATAS